MRRLSAALVVGLAVTASGGCDSSTPPHSTSSGSAVSTPQAEARTASAAWSPIDNARVHVVAVPMSQGQPSPPPTPNTARVEVTLDGHVTFHEATGIEGGVAPSGPGGYFVRIELKDTAVAPLANPTRFPLAFPRPHVTKVLENERVLIWDYTWTPGEPTPMHFHDKDVVVIYLEDGELRSTDPQGTSVVNPHYFGFTKWNTRDRTHTEELIKGKGRAIITELK